MKDYYHHCLNFVKIGTEESESNVLKVTQPLAEAGLELSSYTFLWENLTATTQLSEGGHGKTLLEIPKPH